MGRRQYKVLVDNISPGPSTRIGTLGGMRHFLEGLVTILPELATECEFTLLSPPWWEPFEATMPANVRLKVVSPIPRVRFARVIYEQFALARAIRGERWNAYLGTCNTIPVGLRCPSLLFLQSLQYFTCPETYPFAQRAYLRYVVPLSIKRATRVVVFSEVCKNELKGRFATPDDKMVVLPHACRYTAEGDGVPGKNIDSEVIAGEIGTAEYFLCVSAFYPYKNHIRLLEAFASEYASGGPDLVLIGQETRALTASSLRQVASRLGVGHRVHFLGQVTGERLRRYYRRAKAMVMPSLDETFGQPIVEAMALGCPVVTSDRSAMPEVGGSAAELVDPESVQSIASGLRRVSDDPALRTRMIALGRSRSREFTKERFYGGLVGALHDVLGSEGAPGRNN